jgi:hypothetical protein
MRPILLILTICLGLISCKKGASDISSIDINSFWQCHSSQNLDSASITNKLAGSWIWTKQSCYISGMSVNAEKNIRIIFNLTGNFSVSENSNVITQGNWKLKIVDSNMWGLDLTFPSNYLYGRILLCNNQVLFNNSYIDGCDNLFVKSN